jgi:hypothetical protein
MKSINFRNLQIKHNKLYVFIIKEKTKSFVLVLFYLCKNIFEILLTSTVFKYLNKKKTLF